MNRLKIILSVAAVSLVLAGCASEMTGSETGEVTPSVTESAALETPEVEEPTPTESVASEPVATLTLADACSVVDAIWDGAWQLDSDTDPWALFASDVTNIANQVNANDRTSLDAAVLAAMNYADAEANGSLEEFISAEESLDESYIEFSNTCETVGYLTEYAQSSGE